MWNVINHVRSSDLPALWMFQGAGLVHIMNVLFPLQKKNMEYIEKYYILLKYLSNPDYEEHFTVWTYFELVGFRIL
jgi:hypothetical protein